MQKSKAVVDAGILVHAHLPESPYFTKARDLLLELDKTGGFCVTPSILRKILSFATDGRKADPPISPRAALQIVRDIVESPMIEILERENDIRFFEWFEKYADPIGRCRTDSASIAFCMNQNNIAEIFTQNTGDFEAFDFIRVVNPYEKASDADSSPESKTNKKPFIPYGRQSVDENDVAEVCRVLRSDWLTTGPKVDEFEASVADFVGSKYAVAVNSGTAALHCAMFALGIGPGDEIVVPSMTFVATANCVVYLGGTPVFADVDPRTLLIDPDKIEEKITDRTKAVIAVDYAGQPCDYDRISAIAKKRGVAFVADACHSLGAYYKGKRVGALADLNVFSFHPVKHITTGEGGMIATDNPTFAQRMRIFRNHGITTDHRQREASGSWYYEMVELGYNYRITDFQCALGISQLKKLSGWIERRNRIAAIYNRALAGIPEVTPLKLRSDVLEPEKFCDFAQELSLIFSNSSDRIRNSRGNRTSQIPPEKASLHAFHLYVVKIEKGESARKMVFQKLKEMGIGTNVHYIPVSWHPFYNKKFGLRKGQWPVAEKAYEEILSLPMFPGLTDGEIETIVASFIKILKGGTF